MSVIGTDAKKHLSEHMDSNVSGVRFVLSIRTGSHKVYSMFL